MRTRVSDITRRGHQILTHSAFRLLPRQERDEIGHAFKERIFIDLHRAAALARDLNTPVEVLARSLRFQRRWSF
jgi:hypothetical protein